MLTETPIFDGPHVDIYEALRSVYTFYTTTPQSGRESGGLTMGIKSTIVSQAAPCPTPNHAQHSVQAQVSIPDNISGEITVFRVIGIYGPQIQPPQSRKEYWRTLADSLHTDGSWIAIGDFNAILGINDANPGHHLAAGAYNPYEEFLTKTGAVDLWALQPELHLPTDHTCATAAPGRTAYAILDRACIGPDIPGGHIETLQTTLSLTNHRPVYARLPIPLTQTDWNTTRRPPRLTKPHFTDPRFDLLAANLTTAEQEHNLSRPILSNDEFDERYRMASQIFTECCNRTFERPATNTGPRPYQPTQSERHMQHAVTTLKAALAAIDNGTWSKFLKNRDHIDRKTIQCHGRTKPYIARPKLADALERTRAEINTTRTKRVRDRAEKRYTDKIQKTLQTGAVKHLSPNQGIRIPPLIQNPTTGEFVYAMSDYMDVWRRHFQEILQRNDPPNQAKPWLDTPSADRFRRLAKAAPFTWPQLLGPGDLSNLLAKGNPDPTPGPDDWEKWALRRSGDKWLEVVTGLANYIIKHNYFSPAIKQNYIVPVYKRGDVTNPSNYRGIVLSNTLQIITASWFTSLLTSHAQTHGFVPQTQIATQRNTQIGDLTNLLSAMDGFARLSQTTYLALKRDQKKGFDYIHRSAFIDAASFFGLQQVPSSGYSRYSNSTKHGRPTWL